MSKVKFNAIAAAAAFLFVLASLAAPAVASVNLAPNPSFEAGCGSPVVPCEWNARTLLGVQFFSTSVAPHSGTAAAAVAGGQGAGVVSSCVTGISGGSQYAFAAWYRTPTAVKSVVFVPEYFLTTDCTLPISVLTPPIVGQGASTSSPLADGAWHMLSGQEAAPVGAKSVLLVIGFKCFCAASANVTFDDLSFAATTTTAASIRFFTASRSPAGTLLRWRTAAETELAGFNLYRVAHGRKVKVNKRLIAAKGKGGGASYYFLDRDHRGAGYRLEIFNLDGTRQWRTAR